MSLALLALQAEHASRTPLWVVAGYFALLIGLGLVARGMFRGTSGDYYVASRSIGPFLLLMSLFGTTMTAFALVGSTGKAYDKGIGVYGLMASMSGIVHSLVFFLIGIRIWAIGKRHGFVTQIQFFRSRFESNSLGYLLFPFLVALVVGYLLIGIIGAGTVVRGISAAKGPNPGMFPGVFEGDGVPPWLTGLVVCAIVLFYIFSGGLRAAAMANAFQTIVFMITGVVAFWLLSDALGGAQAASEATRDNPASAAHLAREGLLGHGQFLTYAFIPLSVGMFPHLFQHWLTAKSARAFRLSIVLHPIFIMIVWVPCILIGIWGLGADISAPSSNAILGKMVGALLKDPLLTGLLTAGILAAIMSSLDSQFVCLGTMFTHDIVLHRSGEGRYSDGQMVAMGRGFIVGIVALTYALSLLPNPHVFDLAVWCFSGFASLTPIVFAALYWRKATASGALAALLATILTWAWFFYDGLLGPALSGTKSGEEYLVAGVMPVTFMFLASTAAMIGVSLLTRPPSEEHVARFFPEAEGAAQS